LFSSNPKNGDARISGSLASLCGLEKAVELNDKAAIDLSVQKIVLMQAHCIFLGGLPMLFYGDELGYTNDYSYLKEEDKSYDNRWMHRPVIDWVKNKKMERPGTIEYRIFTGTQKLIALRKKLEMVADHSNITWMTPHNNHVAGYIRSAGENRLFALFNFQDKTSWLTWYAFKEQAAKPSRLFDHWSEQTFKVGEDDDHLIIQPYGFLLLEPVNEI
jgi:amylosucrase